MSQDLAAARLLAEIVAQPSEVAPRLVYADHLIEAGDPRGELIHLQCKLAMLRGDDPARRPLQRAEGDLLAVHETACTRDVRALGFHDHLHQLRLRRGFVEELTLDADRAVELVPQVRAISPLRDLRVALRGVGQVAPLRPVIAGLESLSVSADGGVMRAFAQQFAAWSHDGKLRKLHVVGADGAAAAAAATGLQLEVLRVTSVGAGLRAVASAPHLASVTTLELPGSELGAGGAERMARSAAFAGVLRLQLERAGLDASAVGRLMEAPYARTLRGLRVHHNPIGPRGVGELIARCPALELLDLEATTIQREGVAAVFAAENLAELRSLDLSDNALGDDAVVAAAERFALPGLRHLVCARNGLGSAAAAALALAPGLRGLRSLDLSSNPIGDDALVALSRSTTLPGLEVLRLGRTLVSQRGLRALGASELGSRLHCLELGSGVGDDALEALLEGALAHIDTLVLHHTALTTRGMRALARSGMGARLEHLTVTGLGPHALDVLLAAELPALRTLRADAFDDETAWVLATARGLPKLHTMVFGADGLTDAGVQWLADSATLDRVLWLELDTLRLTDLGRARLRDRFAYHAGVARAASYPPSPHQRVSLIEQERAGGGRPRT